MAYIRIGTCPFAWRILVLFIGMAFLFVMEASSIFFWLKTLKMDALSLYSNEKSGALSGLTRVRKFHQDDAHIFCRKDQIESEVEDCLRMVERIYGRFNMAVHYALSTRPPEVSFKSLVLSLFFSLVY